VEWQGLQQVPFPGMPFIKASPFPPFGAVHESRPNRIGFDIPKYAEKVPFAPNFTTPIASLEHMAVSSIAGDQAQIAGMATLDEMHVRRKFGQVVSRHDQMEMIRHQAIGVEPNRESFTRFS